MYKIGTSVNGIEYIGFSKYVLSPDLVAYKIQKEKYTVSTKKITSMKAELGIDAGYVWYICFQRNKYNQKQNKYAYDVSVERVSGKEIQAGKILSISSTGSIPLAWFGWWGEQFNGEMQLDSEMN